jgi:excisionase family DNA binding protein
MLNTEPEKLIRRKEVAALLDVSVQTVKRKGEKNEISVVKLGPRCYRYRYTEIMRIVKGD